MCLGIPGQVVELLDEHEHLARVDVSGVGRIINIGLLEDEGIPAFPMDQHMSVLEGSLGILPQRLMVADRDEFMARAILRDAGLDE